MALLMGESMKKLLMASFVILLLGCDDKHLTGLSGKLHLGEALNLIMDKKPVPVPAGIYKTNLDVEDDRIVLRVFPENDYGSNNQIAVLKMKVKVRPDKSGRFFVPADQLKQNFGLNGQISKDYEQSETYQKDKHCIVDREWAGDECKTTYEQVPCNPPAAGKTCEVERRVCHPIYRNVYGYVTVTYYDDITITTIQSDLLDPSNQRNIGKLVSSGTVREQVQVGRDGCLDN